MPATISRKTYADMYGPTVGDKVRLGDTELIIEVERDLIAERSSARANALRYGDEVKFGGGKVIRDGMGQSQLTRAQGAMDTVITNALIVDWTGIVKADVGLRDGRIAKIGKAGNPDTQPGVDVIIGPGTEIIAFCKSSSASFTRPANAARSAPTPRSSKRSASSSWSPRRRGRCCNGSLPLHVGWALPTKLTSVKLRVQ